MTHVQEIFQAASDLYVKKGKTSFTRKDIRLELGLSSHVWERGYTGTFQSMISNAPPRRNKVLKKYRNVFTRISKGNYEFSEYGLSLIQ